MVIGVAAEERKRRRWSSWVGREVSGEDGIGEGGEGGGDKGGDIHVYSAAGTPSWKQGTGRPSGRGFLMDVSFQ